MHRERFGGGAVIEVTIFDALVEWMGHPIHVTDHTGTQPPRVGLSHPVIAPYDAYPTADGHEIVLGIQNDREWVRLATDVLGDPSLATDPDYATNVARVRNRDKVDDVVGAAMGKLTIDEAVAALDAARIASARLNSMADVLAHPQLAARDRRRTLSAPFPPLSPGAFGSNACCIAGRSRRPSLPLMPTLVHRSCSRRRAPARCRAAPGCACFTRPTSCGRSKAPAWCRSSPRVRTTGCSSWQCLWLPAARSRSS